jgi:uncharacterized protein
LTVHVNPTDREIRDLLRASKTIAIIGASSNPERPSHGVMRKLMRDFTVFPVNPNEREVLGRRAYATLAEVPEPIDIVDVFRRIEHATGIAEQAVAVGAKALWLQSGLWSEEAAEKAREGGLVVVMNACLGVLSALLRNT